MNEKDQKAIKGGDLNWRCYQFCRRQLSACQLAAGADTVFCEEQYNDCNASCDPRA